MTDNYEQKYKSALEWMRSIYPTMQGADKEDAEHHFPELKESEDERIRKELIELVRETVNEPNRGGITVNKEEKYIAWLEKQGNQKPIEQDTEIRDLWEYIKEFKDKFGRLPKDEDELAVCIDYVIKRQKPADKVEHESTWIEEDELMIQDAIHWINEFQKSNRCKDENDMQNSVTCENWLKSLKDRVQLQPKQEWNEEDEKNIMWLVRLISTAGFRELDNDKMPCTRTELIDWLKSIKVRNAQL